MTGTVWRYDARTMSRNPHLVPEFVEPAPAAGSPQDCYDAGGVCGPWRPDGSCTKCGN